MVRIPAAAVLGADPQVAPSLSAKALTYLLARDPSTKVVDSFSRAGSHYAKHREAGEGEVYLVGRMEILFSGLLQPPSSATLPNS